MSYILNALRKSEQERQALKPDTVTSRISVPQAQRYPYAGKIIAALIALNLAILTYFIGFSAKNNPPVAEPTSVKPVQTISPESSAPVHSSPKAVEPKVVVPAGKLPEPKPAANIIKPVAAVAAPSATISSAVENPLPAPVANSEPAPAAEAIAKPEPPPIKRDWPFLEELPADFSRNVPAFTINVYGFSANPSESFVMIDMVKYTPGTRIKDVLELKEIRRDSLVVGYDDRIFRIRRP